MLENWKNIKKWNLINWYEIETHVYNLQRRIHDNSIKGDINEMRYGQKKLTCSIEGNLLSTRKITQDNRGKRTAGVDQVLTITSKD